MHWWQDSDRCCKRLLPPRPTKLQMIQNSWGYRGACWMCWPHHQDRMDSKSSQWDVYQPLFLINTKFWVQSRLRRTVHKTKQNKTGRSSRYMKMCFFFFLLSNVFIRKYLALDHICGELPHLKIWMSCLGILRTNLHQRILQEL